ncbi:putative membrane protein [Asticcacaulis biprosthecium C19]|uniref:Putative membrane protein n=1 Tax=Asticcacaulis biprosthecium C19 TaxID=715226 RepID=F4QQE7_9CAUL|nr:hypothetical protein [Asticcacaulis biprosthecium]EGF90434.1 putative membrane protein [Asticcacaulis biprosthecium C19]
MTQITPLRLNAPAYGWLLGLSTLAALALISHHPTASVGHPEDGLNNILAVAAQGRHVHGALTAMLLLFATGFSGFAWRLGISHPLVMAGWLSYVGGSLVMMLAALFDGFVIADIAARMADQRQAAFDLIHFSGIVIQALARLAFVLMALSSLLWGLALLHRKGWTRGLGLLGIVVGALSLAFLLLTAIGFDVGRLLIYMAVQTVWHAAVALWLIRTKPE